MRGQSRYYENLCLLSNVAYRCISQAVGMVNDHLVDCFRYKPVREMADRLTAQSLKAQSKDRIYKSKPPRKSQRTARER